LVTKTQTAALSEVESLITKLIKRVEQKRIDEYSSEWFGKNDLFRQLDEINELIHEYGLDQKLLNDATEKLYNALMKTSEYQYAALLAKKYGL